MISLEAPLTTKPLADEVQNVLFSSPYVSSCQVAIDEVDGCVRLEGTVGSFFQKQMAQELIRRVDGVDQIDNLLQVNWG